MIQSKYNQIIEHVKDLVERGILCEGSFMPSENELAKTLNVSRVTVRNAYNKLKSNGWIKTEKGKHSILLEGAFGIKLERKEKRKTIAVIFPELNNYFGVVLEELHKSAIYYGYDLIVGLNHDVQSEKISVLNAIYNKVSGVIITPIRYYKNYSLENYLLLKKKNIPVVMVGKPPVQMVCDAVYANDVLGAFNATKALINKCAFVVHITNKNQDQEAITERKHGYNSAVADSNYKAVVLDATDAEYLDNLENIFLSPDKTGFFLADASMLTEIQKLCIRHNKKIGEDIFVIGYDSLQTESYIASQLTVVDLDRKQQGRQALNLMNTILKMYNGKTGDTVATHISIMPKLLYRKTFLL